MFDPQLLYNTSSLYFLFQKDNVQLREEIEKLKKKVRDCEEQSRKRQAAIKELRIVHDNAKKAFFVPRLVPAITWLLFLL